MKTDEANDGDKVLPGFVILFAVPGPVGQGDISEIREETKPLPEEQARERLKALEEVELRLFGEEFHKAERTSRIVIGRMELAATEYSDLQPTHADVYLVLHKTGAAILEAWMEAPKQEYNADLWIKWLRSDSMEGITGSIRKGLRFLSGAYDPYCFITIVTANENIESFLRSHGADIVRLMYLDVSPMPFKDDFVSDELERDFCLRKGGASYMSISLAVHIKEIEGGSVANELLQDVRARSAIPFFLTVELLLLEREVLRDYYDLLAINAFGSVSDLVGLKENILNGLEEYYGVIARANQFSAPLREYGEKMLGINDIYESVVDRLDAITFDITMLYQRSNNVLTFLLTVLLSALEAGFIASSIALYYINDLFGVMFWTILAAVVTAVALSMVLYKRIR